MHMDVLQLREFYRSRLGRASVHSISMSLSAMWGEGAGEHFLGLGYPVPWVDRFATDAERSICLMPAGQGALHWPSTGAPSTVLSHDDEFPFRDSAFDRVLMMHFLEHAENASQCLAEAWRVVEPGWQVDHCCS